MLAERLTLLIIAWGNTYQTTLQLLFILHKKVFGIFTFSSYNEHSSHLFKNLKVVKLFDITTVQLAVFMYKYHNNLLPPVCDLYFNSILLEFYIITIPDYLAKRLPKVRTYGIFKIEDFRVLKCGII